ncbi:MAG: hypothetical protein AB8B69_25600, partial [Chitinophagales bacterium]
MVFDTSTRTVRTAGPIGVSFMGERYVNRMIDGYIEFGLRRSGDYFDIYLSWSQTKEANVLGTISPTKKVQ